MLAIVGAIFIVYHAFFEIGQVTLTCMLPSLRPAQESAPADWIVIEKASAGRAPERFQIVSFLEDESGMYVLKRVAAFPGETIALTDSHVLMIDHGPLSVLGSAYGGSFLILLGLASRKVPARTLTRRRAITCAISGAATVLLALFLLLGARPFFAA